MFQDIEQLNIDSKRDFFIKQVTDEYITWERKMLALQSECTRYVASATLSDP